MMFLALVLNRPMVLMYSFRPSFAERQHGLRGVGHREQSCGGLVDARVGGLRRQDHGDQQLEGLP